MYKSNNLARYSSGSVYPNVVLEELSKVSMAFIFDNKLVIRSIRRESSIVLSIASIYYFWPKN